METLLFKLPTLYEVMIEKRPSKHCKTPYMADAVRDGVEEWLVHTPSLGCCGLVDKESNVLVQENSNKKTKSSHSVQLSIYQENHPTMGLQEVIIGVHPQLAETIVKTALEKDLIDQLKGHTNVETQKTYNESRLDFYGKAENGREFYLEVKTVPLADYVDEPKQRKSKKGKVLKNESDSIEEKKGFNEKIAYFPDGYRKNPKDVVSPRALKHVKELQHIVENTDARGILCFVIQRDDANVFQPSNIDPIYKEAVYEAYEAGVEIIALQVRYTREGECYYHRQLPVRLQSTKNEEKEHTLL
uniref:Sugar fermentation stimulation protein C-terminal domain-containing protein n=1 Tax=viral metagenome TaxID=1070528 RepID=A0A6C0AUK7_9ZZZZ|tara:strand:- start:6069 stop:6971 length:903 start_codon:yes stop_codon:yes gene_type:complete